MDVSSLLFVNHKNDELNGFYGMWVSIRAGVQSMLSNCQAVTRGLGKKLLKDSLLPHLLRFDILKPTFGYIHFSFYSLLLLINVYYYIPKDQL